MMHENKAQKDMQFSAESNIRTWQTCEDFSVGFGFMPLNQQSIYDLLGTEIGHTNAYIVYDIQLGHQQLQTQW